MPQMARDVFQVLGAALLIVVGAQVSIPIEPVPLTFQTAVLFIIGLTFPIIRAAFAVAFYLFMGAVGLPIYADGNSGIDTLFGPTGGFLFGFLIITAMISYLSRNYQYQTEGRGIGALFWRALWPSIVATIALQIIGIMWGKIYTGSSWPDMYQYWLEPFFLNMVVKIIFAALVVVPIWKTFSRRTAKPVSPEDH